MTDRDMRPPPSPMSENQQMAEDNRRDAEHTRKMQMIDKTMSPETVAWPECCGKGMSYRGMTIGEEFVFVCLDCERERVPQ